MGNAKHEPDKQQPAELLKHPLPPVLPLAFLHRSQYDAARRAGKVWRDPANDREVVDCGYYGYAEVRFYQPIPSVVGADFASNCPPGLRTLIKERIQQNVRDLGKLVLYLDKDGLPMPLGGPLRGDRPPATTLPPGRPQPTAADGAAGSPWFPGLGKACTPADMARHLKKP